MAESFWRSVNLTGNQTAARPPCRRPSFWRSVNLTGNQTQQWQCVGPRWFWRSVNLTGNQTWLRAQARPCCFGAVSI